ncbi:MAG: hypothetical protein HKN42_19920 [Granulosicoccus sp.]|nr:hypothetical protein [Granulosicoccus sp.]
MIRTIGIVGCGPRGLSAVESLCLEIAGRDGAPALSVHVFEATGTPGAGPVYDPEQSRQNWLNVADRQLDLPARKPVTVYGIAVPGFPGFRDHVGPDATQASPDTPDHYSTRALLGQYLHARFVSLADAFRQSDFLTIHHDTVIDVESVGSGLVIKTVAGVQLPVDELVLAAGHQPTEPDAQLAQWLRGVAGSDTHICFADPYPVEPICESVRRTANAGVALRGFGLSMIDVMKNLSEGLGGQFVRSSRRETALKYQASGCEPRLIVPFSLDGLPMAPKPLNKRIDDLYVPEEKDANSFTREVSDALAEVGQGRVHAQLIESMAGVAASVFSRLGDRAWPSTESASTIARWCADYLLDPDTPNDALILRSESTAKMIDDFVQMACGLAPVSLDYCLGQVWHHLQPSLYTLLSYAVQDADLMAELVALNERMKRYAFGPPVTSMERLLALHQAGILDLDLVQDPEISMSDSGWRLRHNGRSEQVGIMINTVLDSTAVSDVCSPLFKVMLNTGLVQPSHPDLGIRIQPDATAGEESSTDSAPIAILGRLAQGSLVGVDSIHACFDNRQDRWARGVLARAMQRRH